MRKLFVLFTAATLAGSPLVAGASPHAYRQAQSAVHRPQIAPYLDVSVTSGYPQLYRAIDKAHLRRFTAAFVIGNGCTPTWDDTLPVAKDPSVTGLITKAKRKGATVVVSFGGENGAELATSCTSTTKLTAAYRSVLKRFHSHTMDFDIEGAAVAEPDSIKRRFAAVRALQKADRSLTVSLTLPVLPSGLDYNGRSLVRAAKRAKVAVALVNVMAMDYGSPKSPEMGTAAISAARHTRTQIRKVWPHHGYRNIGITPMLGRNDVSNEVFSLRDARRVAAFARKHGVGRLAFWSLDRDRQCSTPSTSAEYDCSGVEQSRLAFTRVFVG